MDSVSISLAICAPKIPVPQAAPPVGSWFFILHGAQRSMDDSFVVTNGLTYAVAARCRVTVPDVP